MLRYVNFQGGDLCAGFFGSPYLWRLHTLRLRRTSRRRRKPGLRYGSTFRGCWLRRQSRVHRWSKPVAHCVSILAEHCRGQVLNRRLSRILRHLLHCLMLLQGYPSGLISLGCFYREESRRAPAGRRQLSRGGRRLLHHFLMLLQEIPFVLISPVCLSQMVSRRLRRVLRQDQEVPGRLHRHLHRLRARLLQRHPVALSGRVLHRLVALIQICLLRVIRELQVEVLQGGHHNSRLNHLHPQRPPALRRRHRQ